MKLMALGRIREKIEKFDVMRVVRCLIEIGDGAENNLI